MGPQWVLTAASCMYRIGTQPWPSPRDTDVTAGSADLNTLEPTAQSRRAVEFIPYGSYAGDLSAGGDLLLVRVHPPFDLSGPAVRSILPVHENAPPALTAPRGTGVVTGFGEAAAGTSAGLLRSRPVTIEDSAVAQAAYGLSTTPDQLVVSGGLCDGDIGAPLVIRQQGVPKLAGIGSFAAPFACGSGQPDIYSRISSFRPWISETRATVRTELLFETLPPTVSSEPQVRYLKIPPRVADLTVELRNGQGNVDLRVTPPDGVIHTSDGYRSNEYIALHRPAPGRMAIEAIPYGETSNVKLVVNYRIPRGCGNGTVEGTETCDDGNRTNGDGCGETCVTEACGDGVVNGRAPTSVVFEYAVADCSELWDGQPANGFTLSVNGVAQVVLPAGDCLCAPGIRTATVTDPELLGALVHTGNVVALTGTSGTPYNDAYGWVWMTVNYFDGSSETVPAYDAGGLATRAPDICRAGYEGRDAAGAVFGAPFALATAFEECDDANAVAGDGCSSGCVLESAPSGSVCGNGIVGAGEKCDDGNYDNADRCSATCQIPAVCGDGVVNSSTPVSATLEYLVADFGSAGDFAVSVNGSAPIHLPSGVCDCVAGIQTATVTDAGFLGALGRSNTLTVSGTNHYYGWVLMTVTYATGTSEMVAAYDQAPEGSAFAREPDICLAGNTSAPGAGAPFMLSRREQCDDANTDPSDGCSATCTWELPDTWTCPVEYYGMYDGCDCGCGALDPDCSAPTADACSFNNCLVGAPDPNNNWLCF